MLNKCLFEWVSQNYINSLAVSESYSTIINQITLAVQREVESKKAQITVAVESLAPSVAALKNKLLEMHSELSAILTEMYNENHFYMRTIYETLSNNFKVIRYIPIWAIFMKRVSFISLICDQLHPKYICVYLLAVKEPRPILKQQRFSLSNTQD